MSGSRRAPGALVPAVAANVVYERRVGRHPPVDVGGCVATTGGGQP
ncbi:MAG: hypothetical protein ABI903_12190 [Actinomycetota bacterium]